MGKNQYSKKVDANQKGIVKILRGLGVSVELDKDDILCGWKGATLWYEIKNPSCRSKVTGEILESKKKPNQIALVKTFKGHYIIVSSIEEILEDMEIKI